MATLIPPGANKDVCPYICPGSSFVEPTRETKEAGSLRGEESTYAVPYRPGMIKPPEPTAFPPGGPPPYMPQPSDSTSGDFLHMGPIDPWAPGHMDWSPQAGMTGVRPVVDKYSITRKSTGEWRKRNAFMLAGTPTSRAKVLNDQVRKDMATSFKNIDKKCANTNKSLDSRIEELTAWKKKVEAAQKAMSDELEALEMDRSRLKGASRILMLPEAISRECLELRTHRFEPDQVRDNAEQELIREVAIVGEIRRVFNATLVKVESQILENRFAKAAIEMDWANKLVSLNEDRLNRAMSNKSTLLQYHPGVARWPENAISYEYWLHFCAESIKNCDEVRQKSKNLRSDLMTAIVKGGQDMKIQCDRTNVALSETVTATEGACERLEATLKDNLQKIADIEDLLEYLRESVRQLVSRFKLCMTRLYSRNYVRPNVENCRDQAQYTLMDVTKYLKEESDSFKDRIRQADVARAELMKFRGELEKEIACKRKSLNIDKDRLARLRAHMPTPEEFAAG